VTFKASDSFFNLFIYNGKKLWKVALGNDIDMIGFLLSASYV